MKLAGKTIQALANSHNGSLNNKTKMHFTADDIIVIGNYSGGTITAGNVLAKWVGESELEMLYQGATADGAIRAGKAHARFSSDDHDKMHVHIDWQWLTGDLSAGQSEWIGT